VDQGACLPVLDGEHVGMHTGIGLALGVSPERAHHLGGVELVAIARCRA